jgi:uncharacterized membrane protein YphA (DoxX/SURF4 family)
MSEYKLQIAELFLRCFTGILFLFQGYDKLFRIKIPAVIETFRSDAYHHHIPNFLVTALAYYTSIVEFFGGIFLIFGFFTHYAIYALGFDLIAVAFAFSCLEPMWDMKHVFPRFLLVILLLLLPLENNQFSLDHLLKLK